MAYKNQSHEPGGKYPALSLTDAKIIGKSYKTTDKLTAKVYNSGFEHSHDTYNGLSFASDGAIYTLARVTENGHTRTDLIRIPAPFTY